MLMLQGFRLMRMAWSKQLQDAHNASTLEHVGHVEVAWDGSALPLPTARWEAERQMQKHLSRDAASTSMRVFCAAAGSEHMAGLVTFQTGHASMIQRTPAPDLPLRAMLPGHVSTPPAPVSGNKRNTGTLSGSETEDDSDNTDVQTASLPQRRRRTFTHAGVQALLIFTEYVVRSTRLEGLLVRKQHPESGT